MNYDVELVRTYVFSVEADSEEEAIRIAHETADSHDAVSNDATILTTSY